MQGAVKVKYYSVISYTRPYYPTIKFYDCHQQASLKLLKITGYALPTINA